MQSECYPLKYIIKEQNSGVYLNSVLLSKGECHFRTSDTIEKSLDFKDFRVARALIDFMNRVEVLEENKVVCFHVYKKNVVGGKITEQEITYEDEVLNVQEDIKMSQLELGDVSRRISNVFDYVADSERMKLGESDGN